MSQLWRLPEVSPQPTNTFPATRSLEGPIAQLVGRASEGCRGERGFEEVFGGNQLELTGYQLIQDLGRGNLRPLNDRHLSSHNDSAGKSSRHPAPGI